MRWVRGWRYVSQVASLSMWGVLRTRITRSRRVMTEERCWFSVFRFPGLDPGPRSECGGGGETLHTPPSLPRPRLKAGEAGLGGFAWVGKFLPAAKASIRAPHRAYPQSSSGRPHIGYTACVNRDGDIAESAEGDGRDGDAPDGATGTNLTPDLTSWLMLALMWLRSWWEDEADETLVGLEHVPGSPVELYRALCAGLSSVERRWLAGECVACLRGGRWGAGHWKTRLLAGMRAGGVAAWTARGVVNSRRRVARAFVTGRKCGARTCVGLPCGYVARPAPSADPPLVHNPSTMFSPTPSPSVREGTGAVCPRSALPVPLAFPAQMF